MSKEKLLRINDNKKGRQKESSQINKIRKQKKYLWTNRTVFLN